MREVGAREVRGPREVARWEVAREEVAREGEGGRMEGEGGCEGGREEDGGRA